MNRTTGAGLMVFSIVLIIVGAIMDFAITVTTKGFNINTIGVILLIVGVITFLISLFVLFSSGSRRSTMHEDVRSVPGGQERTVEQRDNFGSDV
jgi:hypothetical protein